MIQKLISIFAITFICFNTAHANDGPKEIIQSTTTEVTQAVNKIELDKEGHRPYLKVEAIVRDKISTKFDFERMTRSSVGRHWKTMTPQQQEQLTLEFKSLLIRTYAKAFTIYRDQKLQVFDSQMNGLDDAKVTMKVEHNIGAPISIQYYLHQDNQLNWKVYDFSIDGISLASSYRNTFGAHIQQNGVESLISTLQAKNK